MRVFYLLPPLPGCYRFLTANLGHLPTSISYRYLHCKASQPKQNTLNHKSPMPFKTSLKKPRNRRRENEDDARLTNSRVVRKQEYDTRDVWCVI